MPLKLNSTSGGSVTLQEPTTASNRTLTLPDVTATVITDSSGVLNIGSGQVYKDASGNVGIGTSSPNAKLNVIAGGSATASNQVNISGGRQLGGGVFGSAGSILFTNDYWTSGYGAASISGMDSGSSGGFLGFATTSNGGGTTGVPTERARIDSSGNLLVGTTTVGDHKMIVSNTSQWCLGLAPSVYPANGNAYSFIVFRKDTSSGTAVGSITSAGTTTAYNTTSDYRLKEDVQPMTGALSIVSALKPCTYTWKENKVSGQGFIAHELAEIAPDCVTGAKDAVDAEGKPIYQGIDTSFLVATLTAAIQEQQAMIEELKAKVAALEAK